MIDNLYWDDALEWAEQADYHMRTDYRMRLAIATNPHLKSENQRALWDALRIRRKRKEPAEKGRFAKERERLEAELKERRKREGKDW